MSKIDAISEESIEEFDNNESSLKSKETKYKKYYTEYYKPTPHEYLER